MDDLKTFRRTQSFFKFYLTSIFIIFTILCVFFFIFYYKERIPSYMEVGRLLLSFNYAIMIILSFKILDHYKLCFLAVISFLSCVLIMKYLYHVSGLDTFGEAIDSHYYYSVTMHNGHKKLFDFFNSMPYDLRINTADYGYYSILYFLYQINPNLEWLIYGVIFINSVCLFVTGIFMYKIQLLLGCNKDTSKTIMILFISTPYIAMIAINGLKEIIFITIIMVSFYRILLVQQQKGFINVFKALIGIAACFLFRTAVAYFLLISLFVAITLTEYNKVAFLVVMFIVILFFNTILPFALEHLLGVSIENVSYTTNYRIRHADRSSSLYSKVLPIMSSIIGPFPNLDRTGKFSFIYSLTIFMKNCYTFFFLYGTIQIIRKQLINWYPIIVYIFITMSMLNVGGVSLDLRYHTTYLPLFFVVVSKFFTKKKTLCYLSIFVFIILIYIYSTRRL